MDAITSKHKLTSYTLKSFNHNLKKDDKRSDGYELINNIKEKYDLLVILEFFFEQNLNTVQNNESNFVSYYYQDLKVDREKRTLYVTMARGKYGEKTDIKSTRTFQLSHTQKPDEAAYELYHMGFFIPNDKKKALYFSHNRSGVGIKSLFMEEFKQFYKQETGLNIQCETFVHKFAIKDWIDSEIMEYIYTETEIVHATDKADYAAALKLNKHVRRVQLKPVKRGFLKLRDILRDSETEGIVELEEPIKKLNDTLNKSGGFLKAKIQKTNGTIHTIDLRNDSLEQKFVIDLDDIDYVDGNPTFESIENKFIKLYNEYKVFL